MPQFVYQFFIASIACLGFSCDRGFNPGQLVVEALEDHTYEIYKVSQTEPLQYIAEHTGHFNKPISLNPGRYLVLADCSHRYIVIKPNEQKTLYTSLLEFEAPSLGPEDQSSQLNLSVQCNRTKEGDFRQSLKNRFRIFLLSGNHSLLVGMKPLKVKVPENLSSPRRTKVALSGVKVTDPQINANYRYFVSSNEDNLAITEQAKINEWILLLPGHYTAALHGTSRNIDLKERQALRALVGYVKVDMPKQVNLNEVTAVSGRPLALKINEKHLLPLNKEYPVLEGNHSLRLDDSTQKSRVLITAGQLSEVSLSAVKASLECAPWEWSCLGGKEVQLFEGETYYPFVESQTDIPILYFSTDISIGLTSSRDLKLIIPKEKRYTSLKIGTLEVIPQYQHVKGKVSDLVRLEPAGEAFRGFSLDITPEAPVKLYLLAGTYKLANYVANTSYEGDRTALYKTIRIKPGQKRVVRVNYLVSEKNYVRLNKAKSLREQRKAKKAEKEKRHSDKTTIFF